MFNDLMEILEEENLEAFAYADDLAITGKGKWQLNRAIRVVERWAERNRMQINRKKSGIIMHKKSSKIK